MEKLGREISDQEIDEIMEKHDTDKNEQIDFEEFTQIFDIHKEK